MILPTWPSALLFAQAPAVLLLAVAYGKFATSRSYTLIPVVAFSGGLALIVLSAIVVADTAFQTRLLQSTWVILSVPVLGYFASLIILGRKGRISFYALALWGCIVLIPIGFVGLYVMLMSACSFGDCL